MEKESYKIKAVSQGQQGRWTTWEGIVNRNISRPVENPTGKAQLPHPCNLRHYPVEVGCRGCVGLSTTTHLRYVEEGNQRASGGGREGELLDLAEEERQELGKEQLTPTTAAEGNTYQLQGVTGRRPCHCSATRRRPRIKGVKHW